MNQALRPDQANWKTIRGPGQREPQERREPEQEERELPQPEGSPEPEESLAQELELGPEPEEASAQEGIGFARGCVGRLMGQRLVGCLGFFEEIKEP